MPSERTLLKWYSQFIHYGGFKEDCRGKWIRDNVFKMFPSVLAELTLFVKKTKHVTVENTRVFFNNHMRDLINKGDDEGLQMKQFVEHRGIKLSLGICRRTAYNWMILAGMKFTETRQTYYTDAHNRPDVVKYRTAL